MKTMPTYASILVLLFLAYPVLLLSGCGSPVAEDQGCPTGTYVANATDLISSSADISHEILSVFPGLYAGGSVRFTPITFTIVDQDDIPRNNVCLIVYTDGFWFTDATYSTFITGTGPMNARAVVTNDTGVVVLYWMTEILPAASPATVVAGTPPTYTAGADKTGQSWIQAYSGVLGKTFLVDWTVKGQVGP